MNKNKNILFAVIIIAALGGAGFFWMRSSGDKAAPGRPARPTVTSSTPAADTSRGADSVDRSGGDMALMDEDRPEVEEEDLVSEGDEVQASANKPKRRPKRRRAKRGSRSSGDDEEEEEEEEQSRTFRPVRKAP